MQGLIVALSAHSDLPRIEVEDGILRQIATSLLDRPSSITNILVDLKTEQRAAISPFEPCPFDSMLRIDGGTASETLALLEATERDRFAETVTVMTSRTALATDDAARWSGTATPGVKLRAFLQSSAGITDSLETDLTNYCHDLADAGIHCELTFHEAELLTGTSVFDIAISARFPTRQELDLALADGIFDRLLTIDAFETSCAMTSTEHRLAPNENLWTPEH